MPTQTEVIEQLVERAERAEADLRKAAKALARHGRHDWRCCRYDARDAHDPPACSCGYDEALRRAYAAIDRVTP